jgi:hypothetical protein
MINSKMICFGNKRNYFADDLERPLKGESFIGGSSLEELMF